MPSVAFMRRIRKATFVNLPYLVQLLIKRRVIFVIVHVVLSIHSLQSANSVPFMMCGL